ncbi:MAG: hypothetical protein KC502_10330 [Myxococcales bacterium]|nr:hypothetical protein [Myxococcales bacterium]
MQNLSQIHIRSLAASLRSAVILAIPLVTLLVTPLTYAAAPLSKAVTSTVDPESSRSLVYDLTKLVRFFEQRGWTIDRYEFRRVMPEALLSVCRCDLGTRAAAAQTIQRKISALGGPSKLTWQKNGHNLGAVSETLTLERTARLLAEARRVAPEVCPYYLVRHARFRGYQIDTDHITIGAEGGGLFSLRQHQDQWLVGGGGTGRVVVSFPIDSRWKLRLGPAVGGAALVGDDVSTDNLAVDFVTSVPITARRYAGLYLYDIEVAPVALGMWWREPVRYGARLGGLFGISAPRLRGFLPWTGLSVAMEWVAPSGDQPAQWTLRMGLRVGFAIRLSD